MHELDAEPCLTDPRTPRQQQMLDAMRTGAGVGANEAIEPHASDEHER